MPEPEQHYHAQRGIYLSSHMLIDTHRSILEDGLSPHEAFAKTLAKEDVYRPAYTFGSAVHQYVLEGPETFHKNFHVDGPFNKRSGKYYGSDTKKFTEWCKERNLSIRKVITPDQYTQLQAMREACQENQAARKLLAQGTPEHTVRVENYHGFPCQIRIDWTFLIGRNLFIVDLKTCRDALMFDADYRKWGYHWQMAFYAQVARHYSNVPLESVHVYLVAVDKQKLPACRVLQVDAEELDAAARENEALMEAVREPFFTNRKELIYANGSYGRGAGSRTSTTTEESANAE